MKFMFFQIKYCNSDILLKKNINFIYVVCFVAIILVIVLTWFQWLSGRVLDSRPKGSGFEPHRRHCVVVLEQDTFILA